ncbi:MAG: excinuclease ABC subunit UvrC, partial [Solirubrobacteraceae bacterium]
MNIKPANLPDQPGVYLFRDADGRVLYVGKAKSIRKRVASHLTGADGPRGARRAEQPGHAEMVAAAERVECVVVSSEAEALLVERGFIRQYRPRFNVRLRDDKSYPFIAVSLDEEFPRVYFTRERHRPDRAYFGPYSSAKRVRATLDLLAKVFMFRSCTGPEPGRRSGSPCLDYYIKRCQAPCVGHVSKEDYRRGIDAVMGFLSGRFREIERDLERRMRAAAAAQEFEQATIERNRMRAVQSVMERQRVAGESVGTLDAVAVALEGREANAQVFQVRDGVLCDRQSFYLSNEGERDAGEVAEQFLLQYYGSEGAGVAIPARLVVQGAVGDRRALEGALASQRGGPVRLHTPQRGDRRTILELAER